MVEASRRIRGPRPDGEVPVRTHGLERVRAESAEEQAVDTVQQKVEENQQENAHRRAVRVDLPGGGVKAS